MAATPPVVRTTRCCFAPPIHRRFHGHTDLCTYISVTLVPSACTWLFRHIVESFVDMVFPDAIRTSFSSLWPLRGSEEASLGDTPDTHGAMFSPCSALLRSLARQFYSAPILQRHSSKIVLKKQCFEPVTSWERCIDHNTTVLDCLNLDNICSPGVGRKVSSLFNKGRTRTAKTQVVSAQRLPTLAAQIRWLTVTVRLPRQNTPTPTPLKGATHVSLPFASCSIFRTPQRVCHCSRRALLVNCPEIPSYFGLMFEPSYSFFFLLLSTPNVPWPCYFLMVSYMWPLYAAPCNSSTRLPILIPWHPWTMAWQMACQSERRSPSAVSHIRGVNEVAQHTFFFVSQCQLIPLLLESRLPELLSWTSASRLTLPLAWRPCTNILTGLSPSFCWFGRSLSSLIKMSQTPDGCTVRSKNFCFSAVRAVLYQMSSLFLAR